MTPAARPPERARGIRIAVLLGALALLYVYVASSFETSSTVRLSYSEFKEQLARGNVESITVKGEEIHGVLKQPLPPAEEGAGEGEAATRPGARDGGAQSGAGEGGAGQPAAEPGAAEGGGEQPGAQPAATEGGGEQPGAEPGAAREAEGATDFVTVRPPFDDPDLIQELERQGVEVKAEPTGSSWWWTAALMLLPWILILGFLFYGSRRMQQQSGQMGGLFGFGKSRARRFERSESDIGFKDVAGLENAKRDMQEVIDFLRNPARYRAVGAKVPHGILLFGQPGTGKTLLARASAGEANVPFFSTSGSEFVEMFVGVGASRVRDMFEAAKREAPSIIFIDEIDSVGRARGAGLGGGHDEREQTLNQILSEMDGFLPHQAVVVMAATNRPDVLDPALLRPGRFDRKVTLEMPSKKARTQILAVHARNVRLDRDVDLERIAEVTVGFSGADLENLINEAALFAARKRKEVIQAEELEEARDRVLLGERRDTMLEGPERDRVAYHEAGHALLASVLPKADPVRKVSIIPRGMALGLTEQIPVEERQSVTRSELLDRITVMLGGRAAEALVFDETTTGADNDLKEVTRLARRMVTQWGMSEGLGATSFRMGEDHVFLGREISQPREFSEHTARMIDDEIRTIVSEMEKRAMDELSAHRSQLDALAGALRERETLDERDVEGVVHGN